MLVTWHTDPQAFFKKVYLLRFCFRIVLITGNCDLNTRSKDLINQIEFNECHSTFEYFVCILMFKCLTNEAPNHLIDNITFVPNLHNYGTRNPLNMIIPKARTEHFQR